MQASSFTSWLTLYTNNFTSLCLNFFNLKIGIILCLTGKKLASSIPAIHSLLLLKGGPPEKKEVDLVKSPYENDNGKPPRKLGTKLIMPNHPFTK